VNFDGAFEAYVRVIWQKASRLLDLIFCNTVDYLTGWDHSFAVWSQWLRSRQREVPFFYAAPDRTMQDGQLLRMQERAHRHTKPTGALDLLVTRLAVPSAESIAWGIVRNSADPTSTPGTTESVEGAGLQAGVRQGLQTLVGLYRLADIYPPGTPDGVVLHRAARELIPEFMRMRSQSIEVAYRTAIKVASGGRFDEALAWLKKDVDWPDIPVTRAPPVLPPNRTLAYDKVIQGGILSSYTPVTQACLCLLTFDNAAAVVSLLAALKGCITTEANNSPELLESGARTCNLAFTAEGLRVCGLDEQQLEWLPIEFRQGMPARAGLLGDVRGNHPRRWRLPLQNWPGALEPGWSATVDCPRVAMDAVHAVLQVRLIDGSPKATDGRAPIAAFLRTLFEKSLPNSGVRPLSLQWMEREAGLTPVDHFGFIDGQSEPKFARQPSLYPNHVHLGEALVGHANAADAEASLVEDRSGDRGRLLFNGSYMVIRKLRQNVDVLQKAVSRVEPPLDPDVVLAKMMGRWPARKAVYFGRPILDIPLANDNNNFAYGKDELAQQCPFAAHIRRANPRRAQVLVSQVADLTVDLPGGRAPRLFRQSMPYGERMAWPRPGMTDAEAAKTVDDADRGLVFMAYGSSIAEQFEVVQRWLAGGNSAGGFSGESDPFLGVPESGRKRHFRFEHDQVVHRLWLDGNDKLGDEPRPIVELQWGVYLFVPSLDSLDYLLEQAQAAAAGRTALPWSVAKGAVEITRLRALEAAQGREAGALAWKAALEDPDAIDHYTSASVWAAIRAQHGGLLRIPYGVLVANRGLVDAVLLNAGANYTVAGYQTRLQNTIGPIFLGLDEGAEYQRQSADCNNELQNIKMDEAFELSRQWADRALDSFINSARGVAAGLGDARWELHLEVRELVDSVLADLVEDWVGINQDGKHFQRGSLRWFGDADPGSLPLYPGWFTSPSRSTFQPLPGPLVERIAARQGQGLQTAMKNFLTQFPGIKGRVARAVLDQKPGLSADEAARTLVGVMMGFLPTTGGNIRRVAGEWMADGTFWALRAACSGHETVDQALELLKLPLRRTMQVRPVPELIWRTAVRQHSLGADGDALQVEADEMLILGLVSATHQGIEAGGEPDVSPVFGGRRDATAASPTHACPGYQAAIGVMAGLLYAVLARREALRPGPSPNVLSFEGDI
ncbi:Dyp-type peroxidase, partial [Rhodoferax sp.]|uniref:Dyp-type peroxidase n=1 Tax=Rhodoferax sp. TaxID=50421 RepID=UPI00374DA4AF